MKRQFTSGNNNYRRGEPHAWKGGNLRKFYAVRIGREGPKIYGSLQEAQPNVLGFSGASFKSFTSRAAAEEWLEPALVWAQSRYDKPKQGMCAPVSNPHVVRCDGKARPQPAKVEQGDETEPVKRAVKRSHDDSQESGEYTSTESSGCSSDSDTESVEVSPSPSEKLVPDVPLVELSSEQQHVLNMVKAGGSVFFTGAAGTGKSVLLCEIIRWCRGEGHKELAVTASTGIASVNIGGSTLHSWAGIGLGKEDAEELVGKIFGQDRNAREKRRQMRREMGAPSDDELGEVGKNNVAVERWRKVEVLIIDEISMIDGLLFDKLEYIARRVRRNQKPFGGIQLILCGDFCQLPPVRDRSSAIPPIFAFDAKSWKDCVAKPVALKQVFRQKEQSFVDMLNAMRFGLLDSHTIKTFKSLTHEVTYNDGLGPTELFPTRNEVDTANSTRLTKLDGEAQTYRAIDYRGWDAQGNRITPAAMELLLKNLVAQKEVTVKAGAQVMLIKNLAQGSLVNGSVGLVLRFCTVREALDHNIMLGIIDRIGTAKQSAHEILEAYARAKNAGINGLLKWYGPKRQRGEYWQISEEVIRFVDSSQKWPVVRFGTQEVLCIQAHFEVTNALGDIQARRDQVPLILAWALSIHKSQGQTLDRVRINMGRIFEKGQAYVALSRATSIERLQVLNFDPAKVQVHPRVLEWMRQHDGIPESIAAIIDDTLGFWGDDLE